MIPLPEITPTADLINRIKEVRGGKFSQRQAARELGLSDRLIRGLCNPQSRPAPPYIIKALEKILEDEI